MIYDRHRANGDGCWHCPFPREWVLRMKRAARACKSLTEGQIVAALRRLDSGMYYVVPPGEFLSEEQDSRGLPLSWCREEERRYSGHPTCCTAVYEYDSIPELVVTDGEDDWPFTNYNKKIICG